MSTPQYTPVTSIDSSSKEGSHESEDYKSVNENDHESDYDINDSHHKANDSPTSIASELSESIC